MRPSLSASVRLAWTRCGVLVLGCCLGAFAACKEYGVPAGTSTHRELNFLDMGEQPKIKAQRGDLLGGAEFGAPEGAIPRGFTPYPFHGEPERAGRELVNPLAPGDGRALERGKLMFERYCVPCHGLVAAGDGTVVKKGFPTPPSLMSPKVRAWPDGRIYHVISEGQNIMPSYASQVVAADRWTIIRYVRTLQTEQPVAAGPPAEPPPAASGSSTPGPTGSGEPAPFGYGLAGIGSSSAPVIPTTSASTGTGPGVQVR